MSATNPVREQMQEIGAAVDAFLPDNYGFVVFCFPFVKEGEIAMYEYTSNANRLEVAQFLKAFLEKNHPELEFGSN